MWIKLSKWSTWQNYVNVVLEMEQFPLQLWWLIFQLSERLVRFVLFTDSNQSFTALNLAEDRAQLSINSSNKPSDIMRLALAHSCFFFFSLLKNSNRKLYFKPQRWNTLCIYLREESTTYLFNLSIQGKDIMITFCVPNIFIWNCAAWS